MILLDSRVGSNHYAPLLPDSTLVKLEYGDACFEANGITVGIEIKKFADAVNCMYSGRLADRQIPGMLNSYDICYLIVEGVWRPEPGSGVLQHLKLFDKVSEKNVQCGKWCDASHGRRRLMYGSFELWLTSLALQGNLHLRLTASPDSTAALLSSLYSWYQRESHHSFHVLDESTESAVLSRPTMIRRMVALLPRVGWNRSRELAQRIGSVQFHKKDGKPMCLGDWCIEHEIAEGTAVKIQEACDGRHS